MVRPSLLPILAITTLSIGMMIGHSQTGSAQNSGPNLVAKISGTSGVSGQAAYFETKTDRMFMLGIENWKPQTTLLVTIQRAKESQKLVWFTTDRYGRGGVKLSSSDSKIPELQPGNRIQLWYGRTIIASGRLRLPN
jgi:hypothetical protein